MNLKPIEFDVDILPENLKPYVRNADIFDSSCSEQAKTIYLKKDQGYFLKMAPKGTLTDEAAMTDYFHRKGLSARVCEYISEDKDYLITEQISGEDGTTHKYLEDPKKLCDIFSESLRMLHEVDFSDCPRKARTETIYHEAESNYQTGKYETWLFEYAGIKTAEEGYLWMKDLMPLSVDDVLMHGDYCLPNILLNDFKFSGFIDVGYGGIGDRHFDLFWGIWTLQHNLCSAKYSERFLDGYGRDKVNMNRLKLCEVLSAFT
jgi:kanamycin kinase